MDPKSLMLGCSTLLLASLSSPVNCSCSSEWLAVYRLSIRTFWDEDQFPKQYPEWRPPAQWSKSIGKLNFNYAQKLRQVKEN